MSGPEMTVPEYVRSLGGGSKYLALTAGVDVATDAKFSAKRGLRDVVYSNPPVRAERGEK